MLGCVLLLTAFLGEVAGETGLRLEVGTPITATFLENDPPVSTPSLAKKGEARSRPFRVTVDTTGIYHCRIRSLVTDTYLILRDADGVVLAEDDDGLYFKHAAIEYTLQAGETYRIDACQTVTTWEFKIELALGPAPKFSPRERVDHAVADSEAMVDAIAIDRGEVSQDLAVILDWHGQLLNRVGRLTRAADAYQRRRDVIHALVGEHEFTAVCDFDLGRALYRAGKYAESRAPLTACYDYFTAAKKPDSPSHVDIYLQRSADYRARALAETGRPADARAWFESRLAERESKYGANSLQVFDTLNELRMTSRASGDHVAARRYLERLRTIAETINPEEPDAVHFFTTVANGLVHAGEFLAAERFAGSAVEGSRKRRDAAAEGAALSTHGQALVKLREYQEARTAWTRALELHESHYGPDHPRTASSYTNLGTLFRYLDNLPQATRYLRIAYAIQRKARGSTDRQAARDLGSLLIVLQEQGKFDEAKYLAKEAIRLRVETFGESDLETARTRGILATIHRAEGELEPALTLQLQTLATRLAQLTPDHLFVADAQFQCAETLVALGRYEAVDEHLAPALKTRTARLGANHHFTADAVALDSERLEGVGDLDGAWAQALAATEARRDDLLQSQHSLTESEAIRAATRFRHAVERMIYLAQRRGDPNSATLAYERVLDSKGHVSRLALRNRERLRSDLSAEQQGALDELRTVQSELARALVEEAGASRKRVRELRDQRNRLLLTLSGSATLNLATADWRTLRASIPEGSVVVDFLVRRDYRLPVLSPSSRRNANSGSDVLTPSRWAGERTLSAWVASPDSATPTLVDLGPAREVNEALLDYRAAIVEDAVSRGTQLRPRPIGNPKANAALSAAARRLRRLVWDPIAKHVDDATTVFVSPDLFLGSLSFESIQLEDASYLIERHGFVYLESASQLLEITARPNIEALGLLALGGLEYGPVTTEPTQVASRGAFRRDWHSLPGTARESEEVAKLHEQRFGANVPRRLIQGVDATESELRDNLAKFGVLHLSTHGAFQNVTDGEKSLSSDHTETYAMAPGLRSGLVLSGANVRSTTGHDQVLTAEEVSWLPLGSCELVVLSACETGLGAERGGEGMASLRGAFHLAGAQTVISSLWHVPDDATRQLMLSFYDNLWTKELGPLEALRAAQLEMLRKNREQREHGLPWSWGAFVLSGSWR